MEEKIRVTMFGKFQLQIGEKVIDGSSMHSIQMEKLLAYLLIYRDKRITLQEFVDALWEDGADNPSGALKNLVYRLRNEIKKITHQPLIKTYQGSYGWMEDVLVEVDAEEFERKIRDARNCVDTIGEQIELYEEALALYRGKFLADYYLETWLIALSTYYQSLYLSAMKELAALYDESKAYDKLQVFMKKALEEDSLDEEFHYWNIKSLLRQNKVQLALLHYEYASKILYKSLGIRTAEKLSQIYNELMTVKDVYEEAIDQVCEELSEEGETKGAYLCDSSVFKEIYRLETRRIRRLGIAEYVLLLTLGKKQKDQSGKLVSWQPPESAVEEFQEILKNSLRIGDVASRYNQVQYIVLLQTCSFETVTMVAERIMCNFYKTCFRYNINLTYEIKEVDGKS